VNAAAPFSKNVRVRRLAFPGELISGYSRRHERTGKVDKVGIAVADERAFGAGVRGA
jgi:hypothetical protein